MLDVGEREFRRDATLTVAMFVVVAAWGCNVDFEGESGRSSGESGWGVAETDGSTSPHAEEPGEPEETPQTPGGDEAGESGSPMPQRAAGDREEREVGRAVRETDEELVAHEWGTFTSVVASDGTYLPGLHHEGVTLPAFVHEFDYAGVAETSNLPYGGRTYLPERVTQKLETPVIYFYSDRDREVSVDVEFPDGYITKWYPDAVSYSPRRYGDCAECGRRFGDDGRLDRLADGQMEWDVSVTHDDRSEAMVDVPSDDIWAPSRRVPRAAFVEHGGETDKFVFYRGVGRFEPPFRVEAASTAAGPEFTFHNQSDEAVEDVYLMHVEDDSGQLVRIESMEAGASVSHVLTAEELPLEEFVDEAKDEVEDGLIETGLTEAESEAMVETWAQSYFRATGYRVLYTVPRAWTDRLLPIDISPTPDELVRTLVGRVEVMTPRVERETVQRVRRAYRQQTPLEVTYRRGRFEEPHFRRACRMIDDQTVSTWCRGQVRRLSQTVVDQRGRSGY